MSGLALEEYELLEDSKYRAYVASVDKALRNFESTSEWADLISTLGKLSKVLLSHMKYPVVPRRIIISKRLAQCLHPALPSGVHLKALEIYDVIFKCMGTNRLSQELFIYSAGLFPLFSCAAMNVRSGLLMIYENHFVPLGPRLRPGLNGFLAATLSGLEEGSDHLERTTILLQRVAEGVGLTAFFGSVWECILNNSNVRLPAVTHVTNCFNKKLCTEDQLYILGTNIDVMVCGLCRALEDSAVLVQRAALDLTLLLLPMHNTQLLKNDLTAIVTSALTVLLRRDMSLNRRLYAWLLGTEVNLSLLTSEHPVVKRLESLESDSYGERSETRGPDGDTYFQAFSKPLLVDAFVNLLKVSSKSKKPPDLRPYKIIIPLLDKPEIGPLILDHVFLDILRCFYHTCEPLQSSKSSKESDDDRQKQYSTSSPTHKINLSRKTSSDGNRHIIELTKSILLVFSALQPSYPWYRLLKLLEDACFDASKREGRDEREEEGIEVKESVVNGVGYPFVKVVEVCKLLQYMMTILPLDTQQHLQGTQMPEVLSSITGLIAKFIKSLQPFELLASLQLCKALLEKLIPSASLSSHSSRREFQSSGGGNVQPYSLPFSRRPPTLNVLPNVDCLETGIIQIGIEAGIESHSVTKMEEEEKTEEKAEMLSLSVSPRKEEEECLVDFEHVEEQDCSKLSDSVLGEELPFNDLHILKSPKKNEKNESVESFETDFPSDVLESTHVTSEEGFESALESPDILETSFLYKYIIDFQKLFLNFIENLLIDPDSSTSHLENLLTQQISDLSNIRRLKLLMKECSVENRKRTSYPSGKPAFEENVYFKDTDYWQLFNCIQFGPSCCRYRQVFKTLCAILVELSSVPAVATFPCSTNMAKQQLPQWLIGLLSCVVGGHAAGAQFTQTAISTFLELVALSQSDLSAWKVEFNSCKTSEEEGVTTLRMLPLLMPTHTHALLYHTYIFQFITRELWGHLAVTRRECHLVSSELLLQLHSLSLAQTSSSSYLPQNLSIVEREILKTLTTSSQPLSSLDAKKKICWSSNSINSGCDGDAVIRWITLWQVSRSFSKSIVQSYPYLNRCLFLMIERLQSEAVLERSYSRNWLVESLNCGDLGRLLNPVLIFLLHPHTRRVSVQHVNIEKIFSNDPKSPPDTNVNEDHIPESQIFAISSVGGEVMYHISKGPFNKAKNEKRSLSTLKKQTLALASLSTKENTGKIETKEVRLTNYEVPQGANGMPISLLINPFSQHPWIDIEDLAKIGRSGNVSKTPLFRVNAKEISKREIVEGPHRNEPPKWSSKDLVTSILNEIIDNVVSPGREAQVSKTKDIKASLNSEKLELKETALHPLHSHMLLYTQLVDVGQCLYGLKLIKNILESQPKLFLMSLASTSINAHVNSSALLILLARHRKSVFGEGFEGGNITDMVGQFRSTMYLQVVITVCLYFIRSYYPQHRHLHVQQEHLHDNRELQVVAAEVLEFLFMQLTPLVADSPRGFSPYVKDLLNKCKVQKCVLHCLLSVAHAMKERNSEESSQQGKTLTQDVLEFNFASFESNHEISQEQPYLFCLMDLTLALIKLEDILLQNKSDPLPWDSQVNLSSLPSLRYVFGQPIPSQPMFLWGLVLVLSQQKLRHFHSCWINFFTASLPHTGSALPLNCLRIMTLICSLIEEVSVYYHSSNVLPSVAPSDYTLHILSGLTNIVHFCLLDSSISSSTSTLPTSTFPSSLPPPSANQSPGQILFNLLHVFSPASEVLEASVDTSALDPLVCTKKTLLSHLPRLVSALLSLWVNTSPESGNQAFILGNRQAVRQQIIELLSPICHHHTPHVLAALGVVWQGVSEGNSFVSSNGPSLRKTSTGGSLWKCSNNQRSLVEMLAALRVLPLHSLVENVKQVFRNPPVIEGAVQKNPLEVSILQLFYLYLKETTSANQLSVCWGPFLSLVREGILCLPPPALLVLLACLNEFVQRAPSVQDKKEVKEQQEVAGKLLDAVSSLAGSRLEATTWLRRNLTVRPDSSSDTEQSLETNVVDVSAYSVAALSVLADLLAPLLDVLYSSEEKERVIPLLISITSNVIPYLRNHSFGNMSAFHACSQLLSSLSSYQYTLKAWRKDVLDLLLDSNTFRMLPDTLPHWRSVTDNLCTHDKTVFKELLNRISMSQGGSLNLFVSKEAEYETRAGLLKRLAFAIFCSETDQYLKLIPDIQERLTEVTRLGQVVPGLVAQVFLCFRVLLLRVSSRGTTSLWPIVITELVQVLLMMEQELSTDSHQFSSHLKRLSTLDSRWVVSTQNGLHAHNHPAWLSLYFAACKLLDLMAALPAAHLPQFQMYRWAFVGTEKVNLANTDKTREGPGGFFKLQSCDFVPHVSRIAKLMNQKLSKGKLPSASPPTLPHRPGHLLLSGTKINSLMDLHPFFNALTTSSPLINGAGAPGSPTSSPYNGPHVTLSPGASLKNIEAVVERDFLEPLFGGLVREAGILAAGSPHT